jgi:membrane-associated phospholipid phosphatase
MELDLPLYAVQRLANGLWLVRTPMGDPLWPAVAAVDVVAVIGAQASAAPRPRACGYHIPSSHPKMTALAAARALSSLSPARGLALAGLLSAEAPLLPTTPGM